MSVPPVMVLGRLRWRPKQRQKGWLLIQLAFVMVVLSLIAARDLVKQFNAVADTKAVAVATGLDVIRNAGNNYIATYDDKIQPLAPADQLIVGATTVQIVSQPTVPELRALGIAPYGATGKSLIQNGNYRIYITTNPTTCTLPSAPGAHCNLEGLVCIDAPLRTRGTIDMTRAGMAARRLGADGGYSTLENPAVIRGLGGGWSVANPVTPASAGTVCARFGYGSSAWSVFVRRDGTLEMTGDFDVGGKSIKNVKDVNGTGVIKGAEFLSDIKTPGAACSDKGALASGDGYGIVCDGAQWQINNGPRVTPGGPCTQDGVTAVSNVTGEQLVCKNGKWVKLTNLINRKVLVDRVVVQDGTVVSVPACDAGGTPDYSIQATQVTLDLTVAPPKQTMYWTATRAGATWQVKIRLKDNASGEESGNVVNLTAIMNLECTY